MTAEEKYEALMAMDWNNSQYDTLNFAVCVYGMNDTTIDNWLYYYEGESWDGFAETWGIGK